MPRGKRRDEVIAEKKSTDEKIIVRLLSGTDEEVAAERINKTGGMKPSASGYLKR